MLSSKREWCEREKERVRPRVRALAEAKMVDRSARSGHRDDRPRINVESEILRSQRDRNTEYAEVQIFG